MNKEDPYRQKTDSTRSRIERPTRINRSAVEGDGSATSLPPRGELHQQQRGKTKRKLRFPLIRILVLFFILLPVTIFTIYTYQDKIFPQQKNQVFQEKVGYEPISIDESNAKKKAASSTSNKEKTKDANKTVDDSKMPSVPTETAPTETTPSETVAPVEDSTSASPAAEDVSVGDVATQPVTGGSTSGNQAANNVEIKHHTVKAGETLYRIAMNYYHSQSGIDIIKKANNLRNNEIYLGQVLKIPIQN